jgi:diaminohydroxyphosphoribosylaminopyrimidine deaminase/5-amino-6-(5-phosphoribosylamino)uracil reductase
LSKAKPSDIEHMRHALRLAERALGSTAPNPAVGCVIVKDGRVAGRGWTQPGGRPHAETIALAQAGASVEGATAYVTLEPCSHRGQTPPCANALAEAKIARLVAATTDPDPRVSGNGFAHLEKHGVRVTRGLLEEDARRLNAGFFRKVADARPLVALKIAQTIDGYITDPNGNSRWITSAEARRHAHLLRTQYDAILVGIGTVLADDPLLNCRLPGLERRSPLRVVLDSRLQLPPESQLVRTAQASPVVVFSVAQSGGDDLAAKSVEIERCSESENGFPAITAVLASLARRGVTRLLVEGGPRVHASFMRSGAVDLLHVFRAPMLMGAGGKPAIGPAWQADLISAPRLQLVERTQLGADLLETFTF